MEKDIGLWVELIPYENNMKTKRIVILITLVAVLFLISTSFADVYYRMLFENALFGMEARTHPYNIIAAFQEIVRRHPNDRYFAARSQLYVGICYRRMGSDQALLAFQEVITNFSDQADVVRIAEAELACLTRIKQPTAKKPEEMVRHRVWEGKSVYGTGDLSSDGRSLCYIEQETGDLMLYDMSTGKPLQLASYNVSDASGGYSENAKFSPDAKWIAFSCQNRSEECKLRIIKVDGSGDRVLFQDSSALCVRPLDWTADAARILAVLTRDDLTNQVVFISVADGSVQLVEDMAFQWPDHMRLSPDGRFLAYGLLQDTDRLERDIFLYNIEKEEKMPLVVQPGDDLLLGWTPDGQDILYTNNQRGTTDAWILSVWEGKPQQSARLIRSEIGPVEPVGLTKNGEFYFELKTGGNADTNAGQTITEIWVVGNFLPEKRDVLRVPGEYPTIQSALDAANPGDTIYVQKGIYSENIIVSKTLTVEGEDRRTTIIDGAGSGSVVQITASHVMMRGFTVRNGERGIEIGSTKPISHVTLKQMMVTLNSECGIDSMRTGGHHVIEDCVISKNGVQGLYAHQFSRSIIRNCEIFGNGTGLEVGWSWYALIDGNTIHHNHDGGISLDSCYYSIAKRNLVYKNGYGTVLPYISRRNTLKENCVFGNRFGIYLCGIRKEGSNGENMFYHNDLIDNQEQFLGEVSFQYWDSGYPSGGNYWSDYKGKDSDSDGIGDTPHELIGEARDKFPLVKPWNRIEAVIIIDPNSLNPKKKGDTLTAHIEFPSDLPVEEIDVSTILLNDSVSPEKEHSSIGDFDNDGVPDLLLKFNLRDRSRFLPLSNGNIEMTISGRLKNGLLFEGAHSLKLNSK
jgi:parallel beta-helix repeat protein